MTGKCKLGEPAGNCPGCGVKVSMLNFGIDGHGVTFDINFTCPACKHKLKETHGQAAFVEAESLAKGMLVDL